MTIEEERQFLRLQAQNAQLLFDNANMRLKELDRREAEEKEKDKPAQE
jgi:hypothetical protein